MGNSLCVCISSEQIKEKISNININDLSEEINDIKKNKENKNLKYIQEKKLDDKNEEKKNIEIQNKQIEISEKTLNKKKKNKISDNQLIKKSAQSTGIISDIKEKTTINNNNGNDKEEDKIENELNKEQTNNLNKKLTFKKKPKSNKTVIICGPVESGKTSFLLRFCEDKFEEFYIPSIQDEIKEKKFLLNQRKKEFLLKFIVTNNLNDNFKDEIDCYFVIYDVSNNNSFISAQQIIQNKLQKEKNIIFFIGNKKDLKESVSATEVQNFCDKFNLINMYISVKENIGIIALMQKFSDIFNYD